jgi:hypothetical protein
MAGKAQFNRGLGSTPSPFKIATIVPSKDDKAAGKGAKNAAPTPGAGPRAQADNMPKQTGKGRGGRRKTG